LIYENKIFQEKLESEIKNKFDELKSKLEVTLIKIKAENS